MTFYVSWVPYKYIFSINFLQFHLNSAMYSAIRSPFPSFPFELGGSLLVVSPHIVDLSGLGSSWLLLLYSSNLMCICLCIEVSLLKTELSEWHHVMLDILKHWEIDLRE